MFSSENEFKKYVEKEFMRNGIIFQKEFHVEHGFIDYVIKWREKDCAVEVKINHSNINATVGQILFMRNIFSHVFLLAPPLFLKKFETATKIDNLFNTVGFMTFENGELKVLQEATNDTYYVKKTSDKTPKLLPKYTFITENDMEIFEKFKNRQFFVCDLAKELEIKPANAYQKIKRLKRMGLLEVVNNYNPKAFHITKIKELGEQVEYV